MEKKILLIFAAFSMFTTLPAFAKSATPSPKQVENLIAQLGSRSFKKRMAAEKTLKIHAPEIRAQLEKHVKSENPEVKFRVQQILQALALTQTRKIKAPPHPDDIPYKVLAGETIEDIAQKFGVRTQDLLNKNPTIKHFKAGTVITIPPLSFTFNEGDGGGDASDEFPYTILLKETVKDIAQKFGVSEAELRRRNPNVKIFKAGTIIQIPPLQF